MRNEYNPDGKDIRFIDSVIRQIKRCPFRQIISC